MKNSNEYINESVFNVNLKYTEMQNKTKELFFKCLDEGRDLEYFKAKLNKLWNGIDRTYMADQLAEYEAIIHNKNIEMLGIETAPEDFKEYNDFLSMMVAGVIIATEKKFINRVEIDYKNTLKSPVYKSDKTNYLSKKVITYKGEKVVPYYVKKTGQIRYVSMATYNAMVYNTEMTRKAWETSIKDAKELGYKDFYIPYHSFSCPHCIEHQEKRLYENEVISMFGEAVEKKGDILHPNCKCELLIYDLADKEKSTLTDEEKAEIYHIRQKVNSLTLEKTRIKTDMKIQNRLSEQKEVDKLNQKRNKVNAQIRELKSSLPTKELQKQVVAINR